MQDHYKWCEMEYELTLEDKNATYVVLPAYNEATRIQPVIESIAEKGYNMVVVNDGSCFFLPTAMAN